MLSNLFNGNLFERVICQQCFDHSEVSSKQPFIVVKSAEALYLLEQDHSQQRRPPPPSSSLDSSMIKMDVPPPQVPLPSGNVIGAAIVEKESKPLMLVPGDWSFKVKNNGETPWPA